MLKVLCISSSALLFACSSAGQDVQKDGYFGYDAQSAVCGRIDSPYCQEGDALELGPA